MNHHKALLNYIVFCLGRSKIKGANYNSGFTLIELLVTILIIGVLSAIALPSFLSQSYKAKQSEAKLYIGSINRAQQAFYLENNAFITAIKDVDKLGMGLPQSSANYDYDINPVTGGVVAKAWPKDPKYKGYSGGVALIRLASDDFVTATALCESLKAGTKLDDKSLVIVEGKGSGDRGNVTCNPEVAVAVK